MSLLRLGGGLSCAVALRWGDRKTGRRSGPGSAGGGSSVREPCGRCGGARAPGPGLWTRGAAQKKMCLLALGGGLSCAVALCYGDRKTGARFGAPCSVGGPSARELRARSGGARASTPGLWMRGAGQKKLAPWLFVAGSPDLLRCVPAIGKRVLCPGLRALWEVLVRANFARVLAALAPGPRACGRAEPGKKNVPPGSSWRAPLTCCPGRLPICLTNSFRLNMRACTDRAATICSPPSPRRPRPSLGGVRISPQPSRAVNDGTPISGVP